MTEAQKKETEKRETAAARKQQERTNVTTE